MCFSKLYILFMLIDNCAEFKMTWSSLRFTPDFPHTIPSWQEENGLLDPKYYMGPPVLSRLCTTSAPRVLLVNMFRILRFSQISQGKIWGCCSGGWPGTTYLQIMTQSVNPVLCNSMKFCIFDQTHCSLLLILSHAKISSQFFKKPYFSILNYS